MLAAASEEEVDATWLRWSRNATSGRSCRVLEHEWRHSRQWAVMGPSFLPLYGANYGLSELLSGGQCWNVFEWEAGFEDGHYPSKGFGKC